jgi:hypothetical protein
MSFNVTSYMKDIDAEIAHHRDSIARLRLKITELEDMRVLMMQREEYRSAVNGRPSPFGALHGAEIAVRDMEAGVLSHAAKDGIALPAPKQSERRRAYEHSPERLAAKAEYRRRKAEEEGRTLNSSGNLRGMGRLCEPRAGRGKGIHNQYRDKVLALLKAHPNSEFSAGALIDRLNLGLVGVKAKQPLYQAMYELKKNGVVHCPSSPGSYQLAPAPD